MNRLATATLIAILAACGGNDGPGTPAVDAAVLGTDAPVDGRTPVDLFLVAGQSNAVGFGAGPSSIDLPVAGAFEFDPSTGELAPLAYPTGLPAGNPWTSSDTSFVVAFARAWRDRSGHTPVMVCRGKGATGLLDGSDSGNGDWTDDADNDGLFDTAVAAARAAREAIEARPDLRLAGVYLIWHQGETDGEIGTTAETYRDGLAALIDRFDGQLELDAAFVSEIGYRLPADPVVSERYEEVSRGIDMVQQIRDEAVLASRLPQMLTAACLVDAADPDCGLADNFHYTTAAYEALGADLAAHALSYVATGAKPL